MAACGKQGSSYGYDYNGSGVLLTGRECANMTLSPLLAATCATRCTTCYCLHLQADSRERATVIIGSLLGMAVMQRMAGELWWHAADSEHIPLWQPTPA
jgi:hypothetical protein